MDRLQHRPAFTYNAHPNRASVFCEKTCCPMWVECEGLAGQVLLRNIIQQNIEKENYVMEIVFFYKTFHYLLLRFFMILPSNEHYLRFLYMLIILSCDVEFNPGPESFQILDKATINMPTVFQQRLAQVGTEQLDVGGEGDCFFRAVSHQLYNDSSYHQYIRS